MSTIANRYSFFIDLRFYTFGFFLSTFDFCLSAFCFLLLLPLTLAFAGFAAFGFLMGFPLFERHMRRRFDALFTQTLVLYLLLMLYLPLFLTAFEGNDLFH